MINTKKITDTYARRNDFSIELLMHSHNVAKIALAIGTVVRLPAEKMEMLQEAALYHDIGKSRVPEEILYKPGKFNAEEWCIMKKHAADSEALYLQGGIITARRMLIAKIIRHHHENWDGSGYPDGIQKEEIPYLSRILKIADVFDAMGQKRIYRKAPIPNVLAVMEGLVETELDPELFFRSYQTLRGIKNL